MARLEIEITALDRTRGRLQGVVKGLDRIDVKASKLSEAFKRFEGTLLSATKRVAKLGAVLGATLSGALTGLGYSMVRTNAQFEKFQITLTTLYKDSAKARQVLDSIMDFAAKTPFEIDQLTQAWVQMKAMGLEPNLDMLRAIGDTVAALGGTQDVFEGIVRALGQMQAKGKVSAEELMQLAERGVPVYDILQEKLGLTKDQLANIGKEGITAREAIIALLEGMKERFGGNMEAMSSSWEGMISNLKDNWTRFMKAVGESGAFQALKEKLKSILDTVDQAFESGKAQKWAEIVGKAITIFVEGVGGAFKIMAEIGRLIINIGSALVELGGEIAKLHKSSSNFWADVFKGITGLFAFGVNKIAAVAVRAGGWVMKKLVAPIAAAFIHFSEFFRNTLADAINWLSDKITAFLQNTLGKIPWLRDDIAGLKNKFRIESVPLRTYEEVLAEQRAKIDKGTEEAARELEENAELVRKLAEQNSEFAKITFKTGDRLKQTISNTLGEVTRIWSETGDTVSDGLQQIRELSQKQDQEFKRTKQVIEEKSKEVEVKAKTIWDRLKDFFVNFWENFKKSRLGSVLDSIWKGIKAFWGAGAKEGETGLLARAKNAFSSVITGASAGGPVGAVASFLADQLLQNEKIREALGKIFNAIQKLLEPIAEVIAPVIEVIAEILLELKPVFKLIADLLKPIALAIRAILKAFTKLDEFFRGVLKPVLDGINKVLKVIGDVLRAIMDFLRNPGKALGGIPIVGDIIGFGKNLLENIGIKLHQGGMVKPAVAHKGLFLGDLLPGEVPIIAQQGEFVVNRSATSQYLPILQAINEGRFAPQTNITLNIYAENLDRTFIEEELVPTLEELIRRGRFQPWQ